MLASVPRLDLISSKTPWTQSSLSTSTDTTLVRKVRSERSIPMLILSLMVKLMMLKEVMPLDLLTSKMVLNSQSTTLVSVLRIKLREPSKFILTLCTQLAITFKKYQSLD